MVVKKIFMEYTNQLLKQGKEMNEELRFQITLGAICILVGLALTVYFNYDRIAAYDEAMKQPAINYELAKAVIDKEVQLMKTNDYKEDDNSVDMSLDITMKVSTNYDWRSFSPETEAKIQAYIMEKYRELRDGGYLEDFMHQAILDSHPIKGPTQVSDKVLQDLKRELAIVKEEASESINDSQKFLITQRELDAMIDYYLCIGRLNYLTGFYRGHNDDIGRPYIHEVYTNIDNYIIRMVKNKAILGWSDVDPSFMKKAEMVKNYLKSKEHLMRTNK